MKISSYGKSILLMLIINMTIMMLLMLIRCQKYLVITANRGKLQKKNF